MRTPATSSIRPSDFVQMRVHAHNVIRDHGDDVGRTLLAAVNLAETLDKTWTKQVNELQAKIDELEAAKAGPHQYFFFTCPEPGRLSNGIIEIFEKCILKRDFGQFRRGTTIPQIILNYAEGTIRLFDGQGMVEFKVELVQQG